MREIRLALRQLAHNPGFTLLAVLVLSLAIGGVTAMFSLVNTLMLRPLPGTRPQEVVRVYDKVLKPTLQYRGFSYPRYVELRDRQDVFTKMAAFSASMVGTEEGEFTKRSFVMLVSSGYFDLLGIRIARGRPFLPEEETPGSGIPVVIVSHTFWARHGSDPGMVGRSVRVNARDFQVVGIAPREFTGATQIMASEFYFPLGLFEQLAGDLMQGPERLKLNDRRNTSLFVLGRLQPGLAQSQAQARLQGLAAQLALTNPTGDREPAFELGPQSRVGLNAQPRGDAGVAMISGLILGFSLIVMVIACLNLANMLLAKSASRSKEMAIRLALGAQRWQVLRQLLTEGLLLSLAGGLGGFILSLGAMRILLASMDATVPIRGITLDPSPDFRIYGATLAFCVLVTLVFALGPALKLSRPALVTELKGQLGEASVVRRRFRGLKPMNLIIVGQVALSLAMLTAAGLFFRGALNAATEDPGFSLERGILAEVDAGLVQYSPEQGRQTYARILERFRSLPGVEAAGLGYSVPFGMYSDDRRVQRAEEAKEGSPEGNKAFSATWNQISDSYFKSLGVSLLKGREFLGGETLTADSPYLAIIDQTLAERLWPGQDPVGRWIRFMVKAGGSPATPLEVVGIVPSFKDDLVDNSKPGHVYVPFGRDYMSMVNLHIRVRSGEGAMLRPVRELIRSVDPRLPVLSIKSLQAHRDSNLILWFYRALAGIFAVFGVLALFLAAVGLYGVKAQVVATRTREFGIRMAIGASPNSVLRMVLREGLLLTLAGLGIGALLSVLASQVLRSVIYGVRALDPLTIILGPGILLATALLASFIPARRAARIQPNEALRGE